MERKTHIIFTLVAIYGSATLLKQYNIDHDFSSTYISFVWSLPLVSIPYIVIVTALPDTDLHNTRFNKTILAPAVSMLWFFVKHRGFTHRIEGIICFGALMFGLYLLGTNVITLSIVSFLAITIIWTLIDDFRIKILWFPIRRIFTWRIDNKFIDKLLTAIIIIYTPVLFVPGAYKYFLWSLVLAYFLHMIWDAFSKEGWIIAKIPFSETKIEFQMPSHMAFRVWWKIERKIIRPLLWLLLILILYIDRDFWIEKIYSDFIISVSQIKFIIENPEVLMEDIWNIQERFNYVIKKLNTLLVRILW